MWKDDVTVNNALKFLRGFFIFTQFSEVPASNRVMLADQDVYREFMQWKTIYSNLAFNESGHVLFSNYGSISEDVTADLDMEALSRAISEQFAMGVFVELQSLLEPDPTRPIRSSETQRTGAVKHILPHRTPNVTPVSKGNPRNHHIGHRKDTKPSIFGV